MVCSGESTDVFVVGGGPAGLATAIAARQQGFEVTLADGAAPPIEKPCGEGMMPEALGALRALGVEISPAEGFRFRGICFAQENVRVCADFPDGLGIGLRRPLLHERLAARAEESGVRMLWKTPVTGIDESGVQLSNRRIRARWIVGTDGQGSRVRRWAGLDQKAHCKQRYATRRHYRVRPWSEYMEIHWGATAQAYVTPIGEKEVCVVMIAERPEYAAFDRAIEELPALGNKLAGAELSSRERGALTMMRTLRQVQRGNVALVGDASGGVDAITGEGLRLTFQQAFALADAMKQGDLPGYEKAHRQIMRRTMLMGNLMLWLGRNPAIRGRVLRALHGKPELFAGLVATHLGHASAKEVLINGANLGWRLLAV
ncbi:MAG: NAD(P)/FAD-dependent oxidoreductase [Candidatus Acidiferrum sp.]